MIFFNPVVFGILLFTADQTNSRPNDCDSSADQLNHGFWTDNHSYGIESNGKLSRSRRTVSSATKESFTITADDVVVVPLVPGIPLLPPHLQLKPPDSDHDDDIFTCDAIIPMPWNELPTKPPRETTSAKPTSENPVPMETSPEIVTPPLKPIGTTPTNAPMVSSTSSNSPTTEENSTEENTTENNTSEEITTEENTTEEITTEENTTDENMNEKATSPMTPGTHKNTTTESPTGTGNESEENESTEISSTEPETSSKPSDMDEKDKDPNDNTTENPNNGEGTTLPETPEEEDKGDEQNNTTTERSNKTEETTSEKFEEGTTTVASFPMASIPTTTLQPPGGGTSVWGSLFELFKKGVKLVVGTVVLGGLGFVIGAAIKALGSILSLLGSAFGSLSAGFGAGGGGGGGGGSGGSGSSNPSPESPSKPEGSGNQNSPNEQNSNNNGDSELDFDPDDLFDVDDFIDYEKFKVEQHTLLNISIMFTEKFNRLDKVCKWFKINITNELNNLTSFKKKYHQMFLQVQLDREKLGDQLEYEEDDNVYNMKVVGYNAGDILEKYFQTIEVQISDIAVTVSDFLDAQVIVNDEGFRIWEFIQTELKKAISFKHEIYRDIGRVRKMTSVAKYRTIDCLSPYIPVYQGWRNAIKRLYLEGIKLEKTTYSELWNEQFDNILAWFNVKKRFTSFIDRAKSELDGLYNKVRSLRDPIYNCVVDIVGYMFQRTQKLGEELRKHLIYH